MFQIETLTASAVGVWCPEQASLMRQLKLQQKETDMSAKKKTAARKISRKPVAKKQELREDIEIGCLDLPDGELAVRVVDGKNGQRIDVRKFIATDTYEGPTKQGFRITWEQAQELAEFLAEAVMNVEDTAE